jgi:hypothetical protein
MKELNRLIEERAEERKEFNKKFPKIHVIEGEKKNSKICLNVEESLLKGLEKYVKAQ